MNKKIVHDALILFAFTIVLGLLLALVYMITLNPRKAAEDKVKQDACKAVFEDADSFEPYEYDKEEANAFLKENGYADTIDDIQLAKDSSGKVLGAVITVTAKDGSQGSITMSIGIAGNQLSTTFNGYSITNSSETPGLGLKASEKEFSQQFEGKKGITSFTIVKQTSTSDSEIEAITGSTITSKAVANACNSALAYYNEKLSGEVTTNE